MTVNNIIRVRFLLQVTFYGSPIQIAVLPIKSLNFFRFFLFNCLSWLKHVHCDDLHIILSLSAVQIYDYFIIILIFNIIRVRFLLQVTFYGSPIQIAVLPINKQAKLCPLALHQAKTSSSRPGDIVQCVSMSATH